MPVRLLREGILDSERVDQLDYAAEVFYRRLMSKVDDHGLYDARPSILRAYLYPLRNDRVREADISRWMAACQKAGLIVLYEAGGKPYLKMLDTGWQTRSEPKYPLPTANGCKQVKATAHLDVVEDVVVDEDVSNASSDSRSPPAVNGEAVAYIPLNNGSEWGVSKEFLAELEKAYPVVDGPQTLKEIRVWCLANPAKRKTKSGVARFVNNWFAREQDGPQNRR
jgi:hypothetical protein